MFIERKIHHSHGTVELWRCEWEYQDGVTPRKNFIEKIGEEQPLPTEREGAMTKEQAVCWSYGRTLGNIAVLSPTMLGLFPDKLGSDAVLPCEFVDAGKFRHGAPRWWCRTHQSHWGTKADMQALEQFGEMRCSNHAQPMNYVVSPLVVNLEEYAEVGVWCSMPAAISSVDIPARPPKIHVHMRKEASSQKEVDADYEAIALRYSNKAQLFGNDEITRVNITPPAAFDFVTALEDGRDLDCVCCSHCGYPHLDLGDFAKQPHRKHFCGNCGRDSTWSHGPIVSTPLKPLHDQYADSLKYERPSRVLDLDEFKDCTYTVWASTPAVLWTAERAQEFGIHVHVHRGRERIIDDTFGEVMLQGKPLDRSELLEIMKNRTIT